ncbi:MAG: hypothetical protein ACFE95_18875 [Candidatus Hodarchaeota archaeon]
MKKVQHVTTFLLFSLLLIAFPTQIIMHLYQIDLNTSPSSSSSEKDVIPLRTRDPLPIVPPGYGIIPLSGDSRNPFASIVSPKPEYFPGDSIRVRNRFESPEFAGTSKEGWALVQQEIMIFLSENGTRPNPLNTTIHSSWVNDHWIKNTITNGLPENYPDPGAAISSDINEGISDTTFTIPDINTLNTQYGIQPGDLVEIYQFYPSGNETSWMQDLNPFGFSDTFTFSAYASLSSQGLKNNASNDETFRQGENASTTIKAQSGLDLIENVSISVTLYDSTDTVVANGTNDFWYYLRDDTGNPNTTTNVNGELTLIVNTSYPASPEGTYYFNVSGDFRWTIYNTSNYDGADPTTNWDNITISFTIENEMDIVTLNYISALPKGEYPGDPPLDPPNANITIVRFQAEAAYAYGGTYNPVNLPVNATLENKPSGVILAVANGFTRIGYWGYTDSSGFIEFNITVNFPYLWYDIISNFKAIADLQDTSAPTYPPSSPHRFMRNSTNGFKATASQQISIDPDFWLGDTAVYSINTTAIRPGEAARVEFEVFSSNNPSTKFNNVPVNITITESITGVTLNVINSPAWPNYYYTDSSGILTVDVESTLSTPKTIQTINFTVTLDFENDSQDRWIGNQHYANDSYVNFNITWRVKQFNNELTIDPQTFIGHITNPPTVNATRIQQNETLQIDYGLNLEFYNTAELVYPSINGVNISILINGTTPSTWDMTVTPATFQFSSASSVTFYIETNSSTPEDTFYNITAAADFATAQSLTYNITHTSVPGGELPGIWVNSSNPDGYSYFNFLFEVKNVERITTNIKSVSDPIYADEGLKPSGYWEVYRDSTTITVEGTYKDSGGDPLSSSITISYNYTVGPVTYTQFLVNDTTDGSGLFETSFTLSGVTTPLQDITIFAWDSSNPPIQEDRVGADNIRVVSTTNLNYAISGVKGNALYIGQNISVSGQLTDDQGDVINKTNEFTSPDRLSLVGWNATSQKEVGTKDFAGIDSNGRYTLNYQVPGSFIGDQLYLNLSVTPGLNLLHFRPINASTPFNIYRGFNTTDPLYLYNGTNNIPVSIGGTYWIKGINYRNISISGILQDLKNRPLSNKAIRHTWNLNQNTIDVNSSGGFLLEYQFPGWNNITVVWSLEHILDNGTILSTTYSLTLIWEVYDTTAPTLEIISPIYYNNTIPNQPIITYVLNVTDPNYLNGYVSGGLDNTSVTIWINGTGYNMIQGAGSLFSYNWTPSDTTDGVKYNITVTARDLGNLQGTTGTVWTVVDVIFPNATIIVDLNENGYVIVNPDGTVTIEGTVTDSGSITGWNSGRNRSKAVRIQIHTTANADDIVLDGFIQFSNDSYLFYFNVFSLDNGQPSRYTNLTKTELWNITLIYEDNAGNEMRTTRAVKFDNKAPFVAIDSAVEWPERIDEELNITVSFNDISQTGIWIETLRFELVVNETGEVIETIPYDDPRIKITDNGAILILDVSELDNDYYFVRVIIFDNTGNEGVVSALFRVRHPGSPFDLLYYVILAPFALAGGFGLAALYERFKASRAM